MPVAEKDLTQHGFECREHPVLFGFQNETERPELLMPEAKDPSFGLDQWLVYYSHVAKAAKKVLPEARPCLSKVYGVWEKVGKTMGNMCRKMISESNPRSETLVFLAETFADQLRLFAGRVRDHYRTLDLFRRALTLQVGNLWNIPEHSSLSCHKQFLRHDL